MQTSKLQWMRFKAMDKPSSQLYYICNQENKVNLVNLVNYVNQVFCVPYKTSKQDSGYSSMIGKLCKLCKPSKSKCHLHVDNGEKRVNQVNHLN